MAASHIESLCPGDHTALIYRTRSEQFAAICPFINHGVSRHERCLYIANDTSIALVLDKLSKGGLDTAAALDTGALIVSTKKETYQKHGAFHPEKMVAGLKEEVETALKLGFTGLRATGEMTWALETPLALERLIEYEAALHKQFSANLTGMCQYDETRFSPETLSDIIRIHPKIISRGQVLANPFLTDPIQIFENRQPHVSMRDLGVA